MRYLQQITFYILLLTVPAHPQLSVVQSSPRSDDPVEIKKLISEIEAAFVSRDPTPFERIYLDGYVGIRGRPSYNALEQLVAMVRWDAAAIKSGKKLEFETLSFEYENPTIQIFGDAAIVTGVKKNLWRYRDARCLNLYQSTDVYARVNGQWRLALGHMSLTPCSPMPWLPPHPALEEIRNQTKPSKNLSPSTETEIRELISKINESGLTHDSGLDAFAEGFVSTSVSNTVNGDRVALLAALRTPIARTREKYRDDEVFLNFGGNVAVYIFRIRSLSKGQETKPEPPVTYSVVFARFGGEWKIAASHASTYSD